VMFVVEVVVVVATTLPYGIINPVIQQGLLVMMMTLMMLMMLMILMSHFVSDPYVLINLYLTLY
jgi:hypothetical protein